MQRARSRTAVRGDCHAVQRLQLDPGKRDDVEYFFDGDGQCVLYLGFFKAGEIETASVRQRQLPSRLLVEASILLAVTRGNPSAVLKEAATAYKVDTEAIATKVKQEFAAREKAKKAPAPTGKNAKNAA